MRRKRYDKEGKENEDAKRRKRRRSNLCETR